MESELVCEKVNEFFLSEIWESAISFSLMAEDKKSEAEKQPSFRRHYLLWP